MARDYPIPNDIPVDSVAARVIGKGEHFNARYKPNHWRSEAPLPMVALPDGYENLAGRRNGHTTIIHYVGQGKWLVKCDCGYYIKRRTKFLKQNRFDHCEECDYREHIKRRYYFQQTGNWPERLRNRN